MKVYKRSSYLVSLFFALLLCIGTSHAVKRGGVCQTSTGKEISWSYNTDATDIVLVTQQDGGGNGNDLKVPAIDSDASGDKRTLNKLSWHNERNDTTYTVNTKDQTLTINRTGRVSTVENLKNIHDC